MNNQFTLLFFLFFTFQITYSQNKSTVTITFEDLTLKESIIKLEDKIGIQFYFQEEWLKNIKVNKSYNDKGLNTILKDLFLETNLNYIIHDNKVILTNNRIINDVLPFDYFIKNNDSTSSITTKTLFYNSNSNKNISVIGKQLKQNTTATYILSGYVKDENTNQPIQIWY